MSSSFCFYLIVDAKKQKIGLLGLHSCVMISAWDIATNIGTIQNIINTEGLNLLASMQLTYLQ